MKYAYPSLVILLAQCLTVLLPGKTVQVSTTTELMATLDKLQAGDTLELSSGEWDSMQLRLSLEGRAEAPIVVKGASDGTTVITGRSSIQIGGQYITIRDLHFKGVEPPEGEEAIISFQESSEKMAYGSRLSNCFFDACNPVDPERRYAWVRMYGAKNRVDHNLFFGQNHSGVTVQVMMRTANARHRIDHNHFKDRKPGDGNGFECIQLGQSGDSEKDGNCMIEYNLFERCDGETEIVSNKTGNNIYRYNTFAESAGCLTLRHGNNCLVENNVFFGKGKALAGGIRIIGKGHTVRNNYFDGLSSLTGGVIVLYTGFPGSPLNGYFAADDTKLKNNLVVDCQGIGLYLHGGYGERNRTILPKRVSVTGNLIHLGASGNMQVAGELPDAIFENNIVNHGREFGRRDLTGFTKASMKLITNDAGFQMPVGDDGKPLFEFDGDGPRIISRKDVGPAWDAALPKLVAINPAQVNRLIRGTDDDLVRLLGQEIEKADAIIEAGKIYSVTFNERIPPSGDKRSYYSTGPYWWRNPDTEDGLPYVRRDGQFNPERDLVSDRAPMHAMTLDVLTLTLAYVGTGEVHYANYAQKLLRVWFIDEETRMLPNLNHTQAIPGRTDGRGTGIIDTLIFVELVDALKLLKTSPTWAPEEQTTLKQWFEEFLEWLTYHPHGIDELNAKNNHGTAYDLQQLAIAHYLEKETLVTFILERVKTERIATQITPDGLQPLEYERTRSWSYCTENLEHFARIAAIARQYGDPIFGYTSEDGANVGNALDYLLPYACAPEDNWPGKQVTEWQFEYIYAALSIASGLSDNPAYEEALACIPEPYDALLARLMR